VYELENLQAILRRYQNHLTDQKSRNFFAKSREKGSKPNHSNSDFFIVERAPNRKSKVKRTEVQADVYKR